MKAPTTPLTPLTNLPSRSGTVHFVPLGGLDEFGKNCALFEHDGEMILVDCGQMMPDEEMLGIDYVIPDLSYVYEHQDRLKAIVLTHAHEDHVGALPYVLPNLRKDIPIYASEFTVEVLKEKFVEHGLKPRFEVMEPRNRYRIGKHFEVEPIAVTHSIPDSFALGIRTPAGVILHSGDYKIDPHPPDGVAFDHYALARYSEDEEGVLMLLNDSTNVDRSGSCPSESHVVPKLRQLINESQEAVVFATFSSSLHRIQTALNLASEAGRHCFLAGLNIERNVRVAAKLGIMDIPAHVHFDMRALTSVPRHKRMIFLTGTQGEPMSGLARVSYGTHKYVTLESGDRVILSSRLIPGNEKSIYRLINRLTRQGATVYDERSTPGIHVSGHAYADDLKHMINLVQPKYLVPAHGEWRQLVTHKRLAMELGMGNDDVFLMSVGQVLQLTAKSAKVIGQIAHGQVLVDGKGIGDVGEAVLRDRKHLAEDGMVIVTLAIDRETGEIISGPEFVQKGFIAEDEEREVMALAKTRVLQALAEESPAAREDEQSAAAAVKKALRKCFKDRTERFPVIVPVILEV